MAPSEVDGPRRPDAISPASESHTHNLHPWDHYEVAPLLATAFAHPEPIVALHLTRPNVTASRRQACSWELFRTQDPAYRDKVLPHAEWLDSTVITNGARRLMHDWLPHRVAEEYAMSSDWDDRWRTGGSVEELKREAHINPESLWKGIVRFANEREQRLARLRP